MAYLGTCTGNVDMVESKLMYNISSIFEQYKKIVRVTCSANSYNVFIGQLQEERPTCSYHLLLAEISIEVH